MCAYWIINEAPKAQSSVRHERALAALCLTRSPAQAPVLSASSGPRRAEGTQSPDPDPSGGSRVSRRLCWALCGGNSPRERRKRRRGGLFIPRSQTEASPRAGRHSQSVSARGAQTVCEPVPGPGEKKHRNLHPFREASLDLHMRLFRDAKYLSLFLFP